MNRYAIGLAAWVLAAAACGNTQDGTVVRVDYVTVVVDADGTETPWAEGVHYIADDGRYRHDQAVSAVRRRRGTGCRTRTSTSP